MSNKEVVNRNIGLTFDFLRQVVNDPSIIDKIPNGSVLEFIDKDFSFVEPKSAQKKNKTKTKFLKVSSLFELL